MTVQPNLKVQHFTLSVLTASLAFCEVGEGDNVILCTHGYRNTKEQFLVLMDYLPKGWKLVCYDQPLHGRTEWKDVGLAYDRDFLGHLWTVLLEKYPTANWHLMGFSMGGKTTMLLHEVAPKPILAIYLLAPAGVYTTPSNRFFSYHFVGRKIFLHFLKRPAFILKIIELLHKKGWMRNFQYRFVKAHLAQDEYRDFMLEYLQIYRNFDVKIEEHAPIAKNVPHFLFWGDQDEVIPIAQAQLVLSLIPNLHYTKIEGIGHNLLIENPETIGTVLKNNCQILGYL